MAEASLSLPGSLKITEQDSYNTRRNSAGKPNLKNSKEKIIPNYLRASTGSCHDFCKYGKRLALEEKPRRPVLKRVSTKSPREKIVISSVESPRMKRLSNASADVIKQGMTKLTGNTPDVIKRKASTLKLSDIKNSAENNSFWEKTEKKPFLVSETNLFKISKLKNQKGSSSPRRAEVSSSSRNSSKSQENVYAMRTTTSKPKSVAGKLSASLNCRREDETATGKKIEFSKANLNMVFKKPLSSSLSFKAFPDASGNLNVRSKTGSSKVVPSLRNRKQGKTLEVGKSKNKRTPEKNDLTQEKTLYVIKMETENALLESDQNGRGVLGSPSSLKSSQNPSLSVPLPGPSSSTHDEGHQEKSKCPLVEGKVESFDSSEISEDTVIESLGNQGKLDVTVMESEDDESFSEGSETMEEKNEQRKDKSLSSDDTKSKTVNFKRGKVVDPQREDNTTPRRLKFRRGRVLVDTQIMKKPESRRSFKRGGADDGADISKPGSEKVVLRHQGVQGKKDSIVFNNVIEETASKLVETRKSKVKALVGAFETVISLQEKKPFGETAA